MRHENIRIKRRNGRPALFTPDTWNHYNTIKEGGIETNNMLESHNRTWNSIVGHNSNVWQIQELFVKQDAEARRSFFSNAAYKLRQKAAVYGLQTAIEFCSRRIQYNSNSRISINHCTRPAEEIIMLICIQNKI